MSSEHKSTDIRPLLYSEELNFLNANWNFKPMPDAATSSPWRHFVNRIRERIARLLLEPLLLQQRSWEQNFFSHLVRHLNDTARYVDARDKELFWQLVQKLDGDIAGVNQRIDLLIAQLTEEIRQLQRVLADADNVRDEGVEAVTLKYKRLEKLVEQLRYFIEELEKKSARITKALSISE